MCICVQNSLQKQPLTGFTKADVFKILKKTLALRQINSFTGDLQEFFQYFKQKDIIFLRFKEHLHTVFPLI